MPNNRTSVASGNSPPKNSEELSSDKFSFFLVWGMWGCTCQLYLRICNTPFVGFLSKPNRISCHEFFFMAISTSRGVLVREL